MATAAAARGPVAGDLEWGSAAIRIAETDNNVGEEESGYDDSDDDEGD